MRESREPVRMDELESKLRAAAPSRADDETLARVHAEVLKSAAGEGAERARPPSGRRWWVATVAATAVLVVALAGFYAADLVSRGNRGGSTVAERPTHAAVKDSLAGLPLLPLDRALALSSAAIRLPSRSVVGTASEAALLAPGSASAGPGAEVSTRAGTGLAILYGNDTLLAAVPTDKGVLHGGLVGADPAGGVSATTTIMVGGRQVMVITDAIRLESGGRKIALGTALRWTENGVQYTVVSDTLSLRQLEDVVLSIR
jgi:hypothetical protein